MFECRLNQFIVEILQEYNAALGLNNPPPTAQLLNAMASFVKQNTIKSLNLSVDEESATVKARAEFNDGKFTESTVDISFLKYELDAYDLAKKLEGSDTVVVDVNEAGNKVEIHLDSEVVAKIDSALLIPISPPGELELVGISAGGGQASISVSSDFNRNELEGGVLELNLRRVNCVINEVLRPSDGTRGAIAFSFYSTRDRINEISSSATLLVREAFNSLNFAWHEYIEDQYITPLTFNINKDIVAFAYYDVINVQFGSLVVDNVSNVEDVEVE